MLNRYVERVLRAAEQDTEVSRAFLRTIGMLDRPPSLLRPRIAGRVARYAMAGGPPNARTNATGETSRVRVEVA